VEEVSFISKRVSLLMSIYRQVFGDDPRPQNNNSVNNKDDSCLATQRAVQRAAIPEPGANSRANDNTNDHMDNSDDMDDDVDNSTGEDVGDAN
jgi:hypothetical protein